ncbi:MAG: hypothetical protein HYR56_31315 [Acidobacteria bacterium]|nr:hypothetical protein [Acidobacteriota bacterium]
MIEVGKKIEIAANISIIFVAVMISLVLTKKFYFNPQTNTIPSVPIGKKLSFPDVDWTKSERSVVLALQEGCHFCSDSAPFYQQLVYETSKRKIPVIAVLPQPIDKGQSYVANLKVSISSVKQAPLKSIGVQGTPAVLLINSQGEVTDGWLGKLQPNKELEVLSKLR